MMKTVLFWILAFLITIGAAFYQRKTGPTHPKDVTLQVDETIYDLSLKRSHGGDEDCPIIFEVPDQKVTATLKYRRYPTNDEWASKAMERRANELIGSLPHQPPAGKIEYKVEFHNNGELLNKADEFHTVVRFKGGVPDWVLIPHIFFIFFAMLLSNLTGIFAIAKDNRTIKYGWITLGFLTLGGMIFGPVVQLYAFGDLWTGVPFGWDLTDNKTLIAFAMWILAMVMNREKRRYGWIIAAAIVMIIIFSIPHSMFGSELDYTTGTVTQG